MNVLPHAAWDNQPHFVIDHSAISGVVSGPRCGEEQSVPCLGLRVTQSRIRRFFPLYHESLLSTFWKRMGLNRENKNMNTSKTFESLQTTPLWRHHDPTSTRMWAFKELVEGKYNVEFADYEALRQWSIGNVAAFWAEVFDFTRVNVSEAYTTVSRFPSLQAKASLAELGEGH